MGETTKSTCLIIGASHAGSQCAISLRQGGWQGEIHLIGDEPLLPYHRPPLSKEYLAGDKSLDDILIRPGALYDELNIEVHLGCRAASIDRSRKCVTMQDGAQFSYTKLVLATGARVRPLPVQGAKNDGVFYLRTAEDVGRIKTAAQAGTKAVIIGGGYIGLEAAASLRQLGVEVSLLEAMPRILQRVTAPALSDFYRRIHTQQGVQIIEGIAATKIEQAASGLFVTTDQDSLLSADFILIGIGVIPNIELAKEADLDTNNGIVVNQFTQTSDPDIYAIGDVTWHHNPIYDRYMRLESVPNATEQAKAAAAHINGKEKPYASVPWFWSDQYDLKLQIAGLSEGYDDVVVRGSIDEGASLAVFYYTGDRLLAVDAVNRQAEFMMGKMALTQGKTLDKEIVRDATANIKEALRDTA